MSVNLKSQISILFYLSLFFVYYYFGLAGILYFLASYLFFSHLQIFKILVLVEGFTMVKEKEGDLAGLLAGLTVSIIFLLLMFFATKYYLSEYLGVLYISLVVGLFDAIKSWDKELIHSYIIERYLIPTGFKDYEVSDNITKE